MTIQFKQSDHLFMDENEEMKFQTNVCEWLDIFMKWQLLWVYRRKDKKSRNILVNIIGFLISVFTLGGFMYFVIDDIGLAWARPLELIITVFFMVIFAISRIISMYYLWKYFDYPGYRFVLKYHDVQHDQHLQNYVHQQRLSLNKRLKLYIVCCYVCTGLHSYFRFQQKTWKDWIDFSLSFFILIP
eukprot:294551_1